MTKAKPGRLLKHAFKAMGGRGQIQCTENAQATSALQAACAEISRLEQRYSRYLPDSWVSQVNAQAGRGPVPCNDEDWALLNFAQRLYEQSDGLFDLTSGVYRQVWNFASGQVPTPDALAALRPLVGWALVERRQHDIYLPLPGMQIDLGGLVKEYAVDRACQILQSLGVDSAFVNLGGDVRAIGYKSDGEAWHAGIQHPRKKDALLASVALNNMALATSGDYERCIELQGRRYAHILHPFSGWPVSHWQSVSVQAPSCLLAGSLSTVAMLMGEPAVSWLNEYGIHFLAIGPDGTPTSGGQF